MPEQRLVYFSVNRLPREPAAAKEQIRLILEASRRNNVTVNVTGALMFSNGHFAQVLEGPQESVEATFERIQHDERHGSVTILQFCPIEQRTFANWSMAYLGSEGGGGDFGQIAVESEFQPSALSGDELFASIERRLRRDRA
jgi:hypothetical protein